MKKPIQDKCNHNDSFIIYSLLSKTHNVPCILSKIKIYSDNDLNITQDTEYNEWIQVPYLWGKIKMEITTKS